MTNYTYLARDSSGRIARGDLHASSPIDLRTTLKKMGLQLVSLNAVPTKGQVPLSRFDPRSWMPPRSRDIEFSLRQLAIMLRSGLTLVNALKALHAQTELISLATILQTVKTRVARGDTLTSALAAHSVFPTIAVQLVSVGEQTGKLDQVLEQAAKYLGQRRTAIAEVRVALAYPTIVATAAILIAAYLIFAVIPELQKFLSAMGRKLPRMTQSLVDFAQWIQIHGSTLSLITVSLAIGMYLLTRWQPGRLWLDTCLLRVPVIGGIFRLSGTANLAHALSVMMRSGIRLVEALAIAKRLQSNRLLASILDQASASVVRGNTLAPSLANRQGFSPVLVSMVDVAEKTGQLESTLDEVAKFCEAELKSKIKRMSQLVEPAVIVIAGGIVGYVYIAFFMALMSAGGNFK